MNDGSGGYQCECTPNWEDKNCELLKCKLQEFQCEVTSLRCFALEKKQNLLVTKQGFCLIFTFLPRRNFKVLEAKSAARRLVIMFGSARLNGHFYLGKN